MLVFLATDRKIVESFVNNDPYVTNGLVKNWEIRTWNVVTGNEASPDPIVPGHPSEIVRTWSARSTKILWPRYREHFTNNVLGELRAINGYLGATLSVRHTAEHSEILVETYWRSLDAIRAYAGIDMGNAVVAKEIVGVLTDYDHRVQHFELVGADRTKH